MADVFEDTASRLWWGVRRFLWVFIITVPAAAAIFISAGASGFGREYEATALVIATKQPLPIDAYAKLGENIFSGGAVAEKAVNDGRLSIKPSSLIPEYARLDPVQENIIYRVIGTHANRNVAADIANAVATAFVAELNRPGEGVGEFAVQDIARVPSAASDAIATVPVLGVLGIALGLLVGVAVVGMFLTIRRPVLGADEAAALTGAPLAGTPTLPSMRGVPAEGSRVPGLAATVKRLFPKPIGTIVLISAPGDEEVRTVLAQLIAATHGRETRTYLVPSKDEGVRRLYEHVESDARVIVSKELPDPSAWARTAMVIDGPSAKGSDAPQMVPETAQIILVVRQGAPRSRILDVASQFLPGEIAAVVFVRRGHAWPWLVSPRTTPLPAATTHDARVTPSAPGPTIPPRPAVLARPAPRPAQPAQEAPTAHRPAPPTQQPASPPSASPVPQDRSGLRPGGPTIEGPKPAGSKASTQVERPGWTPASALEREERRLRSMMPPRAQPEQPLLWQPARDPRPPRQINLDDLDDVAPDLSNGKDAGDEAQSAPRDGGSVTPRDPE
ncbi:MAG: hypothetical protein WEB06_01940 [Actinomycetota bacterium]